MAEQPKWPSIFTPRRRRSTSPNVTDRNPFAPPTNTAAQRVPFAEAKLFRDGNLLVIRSGANLPKKCFVTGKDTRDSFEWKTAFAPRWYYTLLLFGILPFFIVGPFLTRSISMKLPVLSELLDRVNRRNKLVKGLYLASCLSWMLAMPDFSSDYVTALFYILAVSLVLIATMLRKGGNYLGLEVVRLSGNQLWLAGAHPEVLRDLPEY